MKFTDYYKSIRTRPDRRAIKDEWIQRVIENPDRKEIQSDGRIRLWAIIEEMDGRYLRVVLLPDLKQSTTRFLIEGTNHEGKIL